MSRGLSRRPFVIFNGGGLDTKTDPRLVPAGSLVEVENMYMFKTGELRLRNGFARLPADNSTGGIDNLFTTPSGALMTIPVNWGGAGGLGRVPLKYRPANAATAGGWGIMQSSSANEFPPFPVCAAVARGVEAASINTFGAGSSDLVNPDLAIANGTEIIAWRENGGSDLQIKYQIRKLDGTQELFTLNNTGFTQRPPVCVAGGAAWLCVLYLDTAGVPSLKAQVYSADLTTVSVPTLVLNGVSAAQPWFDAKPIPGTNNIAIAWRASAGGVSCAIFNPSTGVVSAVVNTAGADASMCLGFLDDALATGNMYLATAGAAAGVVVRTMNAGTMVVTATNVIDATALAGVGRVTGHITTNATNYIVFWDRDTGASSVYGVIKRGVWSGAAAVADHAPSFLLDSRSFKGPDGAYHLIGTYVSTAQPTAAVLPAFIVPGASVAEAILMPQYADLGRTANSVSSPVLVGSKVYLALSRQQRNASDGFSILPVHSIVEYALTWNGAALKRPRELGGTLFMPGGIVMRDDGVRTSWASVPFFPEAPTGAGAAGGGMTAAGVYSYRACWRRIDATGRITRSAPSVPFSITLGGAQGTVNLVLQNPRLPPPNMSGENWVIEVYRAGPAAAGATAYNRVGEVQANWAGAGVDTIAFADVMTDVSAALGELLYTTGGVLDNFATPSCSLLEVCGNRVGIVNAEDPTQFWPSLEYKAGQGLKFNPLLAISVTGDGYGGITALAAMDGRWILFKSRAIYVISGTGPTDTGQGSFAAPQAVSLNVGTVLPGSVVATPDGIMFQAAAGIYLLDRGLGLAYIGAPVEQYTLAENVVDASLVNGTTQVRFVMASGRCLVWDYHHKRWYTFKLRTDSNGVGSTITACTDHPLGWCYGLADGNVMQETAGVFSDVNITTTAIVPRIGFPALALGGINGYERFYGLELLGEFVGNHTLAVDLEYDYSGSVAETRTRAITAGTYQYEVLPATQKVTAVKITLRTSVLAAGSGAFRLSGLTLWAGMKKGTNVPYTKRLA